MVWIIRASYAGQPPRMFCTTRQWERAVRLVERLRRHSRFRQITLIGDDDTPPTDTAPLPIAHSNGHRPR